MIKDAIEAARHGAEVLKEYWGKLSSVEEKSTRGDLVTIADKKSEAAILSHLTKCFPEHAFLAEESGASNKKSPYLWIIDPLDGTTNYTHQYPMVAISIGLAYEGQVILGVILDPLRDELFTAEKGRGAYCNGKPIAVSKTSSIEKSLLSTGFAYDRQQVVEEETNYREFCHLTHISQGVRRGGSAALDLCFVASGRLDGFWERGLKPWDIAAGSLLVTEAGGQVSDWSRSPLDLFTGKILATNGVIHNAMSSELS